MTSEEQVRLFSRLLAEIAHTLETSDNRAGRVERALALAAQLLGANRCAMLEIDRETSRIYAYPPHVDTLELEAELTRLYRLVIDGDDAVSVDAERRYLALPVLGLDSVIGMIYVEPEGDGFDAGNLRLLSVIAAQLGSYLAMVQLRDREKAQATELAAAHDFQRLLAGVVGHDLRNPLAVITMVAESMLETATDPRQAMALQRAVRNAEQATRLITDLVDVTESRVIGAIRVALEPADFAKVVEGAVEDLRRTHPDREVTLVSERDLEGQCDPGRLAQITTNLVNNALVHGDAKAPVHVSVQSQGGDVVIAVHNEGPPIPAE